MNPGHLVVQMQPGEETHPLARSSRKTDKHAPDSSRLRPRRACLATSALAMAVGHLGRPRQEWHRPS